MVLLKFIFILCIAFLIVPIDAKCRKNQKGPCNNGKSPLSGYFCGRGPTHKDCPSGYQCVIAPNDASAVCCPAPKEEPQPSPCTDGSTPLSGHFCGRGPTHKDCPSGYQCVIAPDDTYAVCCPTPKEEPQPSPCGNDSAPLDGYFCGRGPTHKDCPSGSQCIIAPDDTYAVCCPTPKEEPQPSPCGNDSAPLDGYFCGRGPTHKDCPSGSQCIIAPDDTYAVCCPTPKEEPQPSPCGNDSAPLDGYFCGRGPTHKDCPSGSQCIIAPNDAYAVCCPIKKPGLCPTPSGKVGICIARCTYDSDCQEKLKCCGNCPRECVEPVAPKKY